MCNGMENRNRFNFVSSELKYDQRVSPDADLLSYVFESNGT